MTTPREHREVRDFILDSEDNLLAAFAVMEAYPEARNEVIAGFLEHLDEHVSRNLHHEGLTVDSRFGDKPEQDGLYAYRDGWEGDSSTPYIWLGHDRKNASRWWLGVGFYPYGMEDDRIEKLRQPLAAVLGSPTRWSANFPWYRFLQEHQDWAPLLVRLNDERERPGELIEYFSSEFVRVADMAVELIDRQS